MSFGAMERGDMNELQQRLAQPFDPKYIEWKPGRTTNDGSKCMAMPYADMRAYMERLDELFGMEWSVRYVAWGETRIFCELTLNGVTRTSTGESDAQDAKNGLAGTVAEAQAMKRACAMFGLGRYLYDLPSAWVAYDSQNKRISDAGKAELESRYKAWYARQTAQARPGAQQAVSQAQSSTQASKTSQQPATQATLAPLPAPQAAAAEDANPFDDTTPYYVRAWHNMTGKEYDLVQWLSTLHRNSDGPATAKQYQYLSGLVDALTGNQHSYVLSVLCQADITKTNMPGKTAASALLKILPATIKDGDNDIPNPGYRADIAEMIGSMAQAVAA